MHRLFVDVGYELSEPQLRQHFTRYGAVSDVYLPKHSMGRNKGYAFVTFTSEQGLSQALLDTQPVVSGVKLKVRSHILQFACRGHITHRFSVLIYLWHQRRF